MNLNEFVFSKELWSQILNKNIITDALIETELYRAYFRLKEDYPIWLKLWHYLNLTDEEFLNIFKNSNKNDLKHSLGI